MKHVYLWLALRLMRRQKGRTVTLFFGVLMTAALLSAFFSLGFYFWQQLHTEGAGAVYDATQWILLALAMVLILLITACAAALLRNLFSLTGRQRHNSLKRLSQLGAKPSAIVFIKGLEIVILYVTATPLGMGLGLLLGTALTGMRIALPLPLLLGTALGELVITVLCGGIPVRSRNNNAKPLQKHNGSRCPNENFLRKRRDLKIHMLLNRGHRAHAFVSMVLAMLLYIPVSYLINTNLDVHRDILEQTYGIEYSCHVENDKALAQSLQEYNTLAAQCSDASSMVYVQQTVMVRIYREALSEELIKALKAAGWSEEEVWENQATLVFLEDSIFNEWMKVLDADNGAEQPPIWNVDDALQHPQIWGADDVVQPYKTKPAVLINRVVNRTRYAEAAGGLFKETPLLKDGVSLSECVAVFDGFEPAPGETPRLCPHTITDRLPKDFDFTGEITIILPLEQLTENYYQMRSGENASQITAEVHSQQTDLWQNTTVCGFFRDDNVDTNASADTYSRLETALGPQPLGRLLNIRANIKEWYTSMEQIHRIMTALCVMLLTIALTNLFCTIVFEYMEQQHSIAILWSVGISPRGLLKMSVSRCLRELLKAAIVGIFLSVILCYSIYNIFIYVWQRAFHLPWLQLAVVGGLGLCIAGLAFVLEYKIMKRQDFLAAIRKCAD